jgi:Asp-tRNA(Asn)/Glu-tRNA(Gln) amidotransferase A subunit family amidase
MALCWSLDKAGPLARSAEDAALVFETIAGFDRDDDGSIDVPVRMAWGSAPGPRRIGYIEKEYGRQRVAAADKQLLEVLKGMHCELVPLSIPQENYAEIIQILIFVEGAAAFDEMTRSNRDDELRWQVDAAWPNTFRATRLFPAVEYMQARRVRRRIMKLANELFAGVDAIVAPSAHGDLHAITNMTGQPALTLRIGIRDNGTPLCATLWAPLFEDESLLELGCALERKLQINGLRPKMDW